MASLERELPPEIWDKRTSIEVAEHRTSLQCGEKILDVFYRDASPPGGIVKRTALLLLHGMRFKSQTWLDLGTIQLAAAMGHRVVAVDLPGYGESGVEKFAGDTSEFMRAFCSAVELVRPVIVSPSMSGTYALPYLLSDPASATDRASAYIPVAPITTEKYTKDQYEQCAVSTLILYGSNDKSLGFSSLANLSALKNSRVYEMVGAGHACYLDKPDEWHRVLYNFLCIVESM